MSNPYLLETNMIRTRGIKKGQSLQVISSLNKKQHGNSGTETLPIEVTSPWLQDVSNMSSNFINAWGIMQKKKPCPKQTDL